MDLTYKIEVDGNDGVGKSTLVRCLKNLGFSNVSDRGRMTEATDDSSLLPEEGVLYLLLTASPNTSLERLKKRGADLEEFYHKPETLIHYHKKFLELSETTFRKQCRVVSSEGNHVWVTTQALKSIAEYTDSEKLIRIGIASGRLRNHVNQAFYVEVFGSLMPMPSGRAYYAKEGPFYTASYRSKAYPQMVTFGSLDVAIVGSDVLEASPYASHLEVTHRKSQEGVKICIAAKGDKIPDRRPLRVATPFSGWAQKVFGGRGIAHVLFPVKGGTEGLVAQGLADVVFDIVETGDTLKENGLQVVEDLGGLDVCVIRRRS